MTVPREYLKGFSYKKVVHEKYTYKDGKKYGPYLYETKRVDGKVITKYLGNESPSKISRYFIFLAVVALVAIFMYFVYLKSYSNNGSLTGKLSLEINLAYEEGKPITGKGLDVRIKEGECLPIDSDLVVNYGTQSKTVKFSSLIKDEPITGDYYVENSQLSGSGECYGSLGTMITYPDVAFKVLISDGVRTSPADSSEAGIGVGGTIAAAEPSGGSAESVVGESESGSSGSDSGSSSPSSSSSGSSSSNSGSVSSAGSTQSSSSSTATTSGESGVAHGTSVSSSGGVQSASSAATTSGESTTSVTGAVSSETEYTIDGITSYKNDFTYNLPEGKTAQIVEGSVTIDGKSVSDQTVSLSTDNGKLVVSTERFDNKKGFGKDYLGDYATKLQVDVGQLGLIAEPGEIEVQLVKDNQVLASQKQKINVLSTFGEINDTNATQTGNQTINDTNLTIIQSLPTVRIGVGQTATIDLANYFPDAESYTVVIPNVAASFDGSILTLTPDADFKGIRLVKVLAQGRSGEMEGDFNLIVSSLNVVTSRAKIVAGERVKNVKQVSFDESGAVNIELPSSAQDITVKKIDEQGNEIPQTPSVATVSGSSVSGNVVIDLNLRNEPLFARLWNSIVHAITGKAVDTPEVTLESKPDVTLDGAGDYTIEYYTDAPTLTEEDTARGKIVTVSASDELEYEDVFVPVVVKSKSGTAHVYWTNAPSQEQVTIKTVDQVPETTVIEDTSVENTEGQTVTGNVVSDSVSTDNVADSSAGVETVIGNNGRVEIPSETFDLGNGEIEVDFIAPHLSNQTFEIIVITHADHLNETRGFISDIYDSVKSLDGNWSETISDGHYVRVTFETNLTNVNDITLYPRVVSGTPHIDVLEAGGNVTLAQFSTLSDNVSNTVYLTNLTRSRNDFDLHVVGGVCQFDYIVDPFTDSSLMYQNVSDCGKLNTSGATYFINQTFIPTAADVCLNITASNVTLNCQGYNITGTSYAKSAVYINNQNNVTVLNCNISIATAVVGAIGIQVAGTSSNARIVNNAINSRVGMTLSGSGTELYFANNTISATCVTGVAVTGTPSNSTFTNNTISGCGSNFVSTTNTIYNWTFFRNNFVGATTNGMSLQVESSTIDGNNISGNGNQGINLAVGYGPRNVIKNNLFMSNSVTGLRVQGVNSTLLVTNNTFFGGKATLNISAGSFNNFTHNILLNSLYGIAVTAPVTDNYFVNNTINGSTVEALRIDGASGVFNNTFENNTISSTAIGALDLRIASAGNNGSMFIDTSIGNYSIAGTGALITFRSSRFGEIRFLNSINGSGTNLSADIVIGNNSAFVNSTNQIGLNRSANITLYNIPTTFTSPSILRDGVACSSSICTNLTALTAGTVVFNVTGWSNYSITGTLGSQAVMPLVSFVSPTPSQSSTLFTTAIPINVSSNATSQHYAFVDMNRDLKLWMRFDDLNGSSDPTDLSSWSNNGSKIGSSLTVGSAKLGSGLILNGAANNYIVVPNSVSLSRLTEITMSAWFNTSSVQVARVIVSKHSGGTGGEYMLATTATTLRFTTINASLTRVDCDYTTTYNDGLWHNLVGVYNGTQARVYLDNINVVNCTQYGVLQAVANNLVIGDFAGFTQPFNGTIDDVMIFNRSLTTPEVGSLYNASSNQYYRNFTGLAVGQYNFTAYAVDGAGNKNQTAVRTVNLAASVNYAPTFNFTNVNFTHQWVKSGQNLFLNVTCSDANGDSLTYNWTVDGVQTAPTSNFSFAGASYSVGLHNVSVYCADASTSSSTTNLTVEVLNSDDFILVSLPDTQYYSQSYPYVFSNQTKWAGELQNSIGLVFLMHEGDVVQDGYNGTQWMNANQSMTLLDDKGVNYEVTSGNHDYRNIGDISDRDLTNYSLYFPLGRFQRMTTYGGSYDGTGVNSYHLFEASGQKFLALTYEFCPRNATLDWANSIISAYPDRRVIITTHMYMNYNDLRSNSTSDYSCFAYSLAGDNDGERQWGKLVANHSNIALVISGHLLGDGTGYRNDTGQYGNTVHQLLANYQTETGNPSGGNGWLRVYVVRPSHNTIDSEAYSPFLDRRNYTSEQTFPMYYNFSQSSNLQYPTISFTGQTPANASSQTATAIAVNVSSTSAGNHYVVTDFNRDLRLWMRFDDLNSTNGVIDLSSWSNNGTMIGNVTQLSTGRFGKSALFNATASLSYVVVPNSASLSGLSQVTLSAWFNTSTDHNGVIVGKHGGGTGGEYFLSTIVGGNSLRFTVINASATRVNCDATINYRDSLWHNFVGTYNGTQATIYVDNVNLVNCTQYGVLNSVVSNVILGNFDSGFSQNFNGTMDDVMIFNRSLSLVEVASLYNASVNQYYNNFTNLSVGQYTFTSYAVDNTGNKNQTEARVVNISGTPTVVLNLTAPLNTTYTSIQTALNYTVSNNPQACWYSLDLGVTNVTVTCGTNVTGLSSNQGSNTWKVYANNTLGSINFSSVTFFVDSLSPTIDFVNPTETNASTLSRSNVMINVTSNDTNLANITIRLYNSTGVVNQTTTTSSPNYINVTSLVDGTYYFNATATDTFGNRNVTVTRVVTLLTGAPIVNVTAPLNRTYNQVQTVLNYTVFNSPQACWYSTNLGVTNTTVTCGVNVSGLASVDGTNVWMVFANSSGGNINFSSVTFVVDSMNPGIAFDLGTENTGEVSSGGAVYINASVNETNVANVTYTLYNSTSVINTTVFSSLVTNFNFTNLVDGFYTYQVNITDAVSNRNGTTVRSIRLISSCLNSNCSEGGACVIANTTCLLNSELCTGGICDFANLTIQNATVYTLYNGSGNGNSLVVNLSSNLSSAMRFFNISQIIFSGKNGTTLGTGSIGGNAGVVNITAPGLFNRTIARFIGIGGKTTTASGAGGNGGILQINYHGLVRNATVTQFTEGNSTSGVLGTVGTQLLMKDSVCPRDTDVTDPAGSNSSLGLVDLSDITFIVSRYGNESTDSTYRSGADVNCDNTINIIDLAKVGMTFGKR